MNAIILCLILSFSLIIEYFAKKRRDDNAEQQEIKPPVLLLPAPKSQPKSVTLDDLIRQYNEHYTPITQAMIKTVNARKYPRMFLNTINTVAHANKRKPLDLRASGISNFVYTMEHDPKVRLLVEFDELTPVELCAIYQYLIGIVILEPTLNEYIQKNI